MELINMRRWYTNNTTIGELYNCDDMNTRIVYILEPTVRVGDDPRGVLAIPEGRFEVTMYDSPKHGRVPLLNGVPGHTFVEIHPGDFECDTLDCQLPGMQMAVDRVLESVIAFGVLVPLIETALNTGQVWYNIKNTGA